MRRCKLGAPWKQPNNITVVLTSGTGGTGFIGVQLAKALGAAHIVTAATGADNIALMKSYGADVVIDYKQQNIFDALPDNSVDLVYDNYAAPGTCDRAMHAVRPGGSFLLLPNIMGAGKCKKPKTGVKYINFGYTDSASYKGLDTLKGFFDSGALKAKVQQAFPLSQAADAFSLNAKGQVVGKVAVNPNA